MSQPQQPKKIIVFTTPSCAWCTRVKDYLRRKRLPFREVDISRDPKAAEDMVRKTGQQGVPVTLINGRPVVGFNQARIEQLLK